MVSSHIAGNISGSPHFAVELFVGSNYSFLEVNQKKAADVLDYVPKVYFHSSKIQSDQEYIKRSSLPFEEWFEFHRTRVWNTWSSRCP